MREPVAAGTFYPRNPEELKAQVGRYLADAEPGEGWGAVAPHAGYRFSGELAARSCRALRDSDTYLLLGPNHSGTGEPVALSDQDWRTPLGDVTVNDSIAGAIDVPVDEEAHAREHSLEVQLPFLQVERGSFSIVPISMKDQSRGAARGLADELELLVDDSPLLVSSDLTHYAPLGEARDRDEAFIERVKGLDIGGIYEGGRAGSICGYGPIAVAVMLARRGDSEATLLGYSTSEEATGDASSVVGYCSVLFS